MRISDWSSDVCSSDLGIGGDGQHRIGGRLEQQVIDQRLVVEGDRGDLGRQRKDDVEVADREQVGLARFEPGARGGALAPGAVPVAAAVVRSEEHTSELQSLMRISYAVFCLKKKKHIQHPTHIHFLLLLYIPYPLHYVHIFH